jgi:hypothetical protein
VKDFYLTSKEEKERKSPFVWLLKKCRETKLHFFSKQNHHSTQLRVKNRFVLDLGYNTTAEFFALLCFFFNRIFSAIKQKINTRNK